jgi:hypothetical protein
LTINALLDILIPSTMISFTTQKVTAGASFMLALVFVSWMLSMRSLGAAVVIEPRTPT